MVHFDWSHLKWLQTLNEEKMRNKEMLKKTVPSGSTRSTDTFADPTPWHPHFSDGVVDISGPPFGTNGSNYGCNKLFDSTSRFGFPLQTSNSELDGTPSWIMLRRLINSKISNLDDERSNVLQLERDRRTRPQSKNWIENLENSCFEEWPIPHIWLLINSDRINLYNPCHVKFS